MIRIFSILSIFAICMIFTGSAGVFWLSLSDLETAKKESVDALAKSLSFNISVQLEQQQQTIHQIAAHPEVIAAVESGNLKQIKDTAKSLQAFLPNALKLRILLPNIKDVDETEIPHFGYADLQMVQKTFTSQPIPIIQGRDEHRHLAITAPIKKGETVIGVVLASLKFDFLNATLAKAPVGENFFEIKQDKVILASNGQRSIQSGAGTEVKILKSKWSVEFWADGAYGFGEITIMLAIILVASLLMCAALFFAYYQITQLLKKDQTNVLQAVKDLMTGQGLGNYPVNLAEMKVIISTLVQFKRILDNKQSGGHKLDSFQEPTHSSKTEHSDMLNSLDDNVTDTISSKSSEKTSLKKKKLNPPKEELPKKEIKPTEIDLKPNPPQKTSSKVSPKVAERLSTHTIITEEKKPQLENIFKAYDIRGIVGKGITKQVVYDVGMAIGTEAQKYGNQVVVARDGRLSGTELSEALKKGIASTGCDVLDLGMVPTPMLYFVSFHIEGRSGVMLTGSHNPPEYNGLKIVIHGEALAGEKIQNIKKIVDDEDFITKPMGKIEQNSAYAEEYIGTIIEEVQVKKKLKVVVDCGNGVASELAPEILKAIGCDVIELFCEIDGNFPNHHPDPSKPENLTALIEAVKENSADLGIAFDGDADRLGVVDSNGNIIWPDRLMMLFTQKILKIKPAAEIVYDVKCSSHLEKEIKKQGGRPLMWKSGHSFIKEKVHQTGAIFAGEMTGHFYFNDRWFGFDDALYASARLIEVLSEDKRDCTEIFASLPNSISTPELNIPMKEGENFSFMEEFTHAAKFSDAKIIDIDGLRIEFKDGWGLVRASNTTPALSVRFEADNEKSLKRIQKKIKHLMGNVNPDITFPF